MTDAQWFSAVTPGRHKISGELILLCLVLLSMSVALIGMTIGLVYVITY